MFWLAANVLGHAAPTELEKLMERRGFYKHDAPLELAWHALQETEMRPQWGLDRACSCSLG